MPVYIVFVTGHCICLGYFPLSLYVSLLAHLYLLFGLAMALAIVNVVVSMLQGGQGTVV